MRNVFDQYSHPENRLTHSLATALHEDRALLKSFLTSFGLAKHPALNTLKVIEQGFPGKVENDEDEAERQGLPDALIFNEDGWALAIESKISSGLTKDQLRRHTRTVQRCGFDEIHGLSITVNKPRFDLDGWKMVTWRDIYSWGNQNRSKSTWARYMVEYFNVAESKMANDGYLKEGTITEFSGISFDPYTYLEGKRVLRLFMRKLREDEAFLDYMGIDKNTSGRHAISNQPRLWDYLPLTPHDGKEVQFTQYPHCTVGMDGKLAECVVTFPNGMSNSLRRALCGNTSEEFSSKLQQAAQDIKAALKGTKGYRPFIRIQQRRYPSQKSVPIVDGIMEFDLRTSFGDERPDRGPSIKAQPEWSNAVYELWQNKKSNIQFQIGVQFIYDQCDKIKTKDADKLFVAVFKALRPFTRQVIEAGFK